MAIMIPKVKADLLPVSINVGLNRFPTENNEANHSKKLLGNDQN